MCQRIKKYRESGQSLMEVVIVLGVTAVVIVALVIVVLTSLKNAKFAQNQANATKFAQEAMEQIKAVRDRNGSISFASDNPACVSRPFTFASLWNCRLSSSDSNPCTTAEAPGAINKCYFILSGNGAELSEPLLPERINQDLGNGLFRQIVISDDETSDDETSYDKEKNVTILVFWNDAEGRHESNLQTKLTKY